MPFRSPGDTVHSPAVQAIGVANAALGLAGVLFPRQVAAAVSGRGSAPPAPIVRILGLRQFVQGVITTAVPTDDVVVLGAAVDLTHAASMVPVFAWPTHRRAALISAALATASAAAGLAARRH